MAEGIVDALAEGWREFRGVGGVPGHGETLLGPDRTAYCGKAVDEGWPLLVVPSAGRGLGAGTAVEARRQQGDDREQSEQAWRGAGDGFARPLTPGFHAEVVADLAEGDFELPALDEPANGLHRLLGWIGAEQGLRIEAPAGIAQRSGHCPGPQRIGTIGSPAWRQTAVSEQISTTRSPSPYQPGTVTCCQRVVLSASTSARVGKRSPLVLGRPMVPGRRGGAGR